MHAIKPIDICYTYYKKLAFIYLLICKMLKHIVIQTEKTVSHLNIAVYTY